MFSTHALSNGVDVDIVSYVIMLANHNHGSLLTSLKGATP